jgi:hypothetical protein
MKITKKLLEDKSNWSTCECGNEVPDVYSVTDNDGCVSCAECHFAWLNDIIKMYRSTILELGNIEKANELIKGKISEYIGVDSDDLESEWLDQILITHE